MPDYSVAAYTVKVRPRNSAPKAENYLNHSDFDGAGTDVLQFIYALFRSIDDDVIHDKGEEKALSISNLEICGRVLRTEMESGGHGYVSRLFDVNTKTEMYRRQVTDAELLPLRNVFMIPTGAPIGLFMTERQGIRGLKSTLVKLVKRSFVLNFPDFVIDILPLAPEDAVRSALAEGEIKGLRLVRYGIPQDIAEKFDLGAHEDYLGTVELVAKPPRGLSFRKQGLSRVLEEGDKAGLLEWNGVVFGDIKIEVKVGGKIRTVTVTKEKSPRVTFPVANDIETDANGRPTDSALYEHAMAVARDLGAEIGLPFERLHASFEWTDAMFGRLVRVADLEG